MNDLFYVVETAIDYVFQKDKYVLNLYEYAKSCKMTKNEMTQFINSSTAAELSDLCCLLYTSPSPRDKRQSRMPSSA